MLDKLSNAVHQAEGINEQFVERRLVVEICQSLVLEQRRRPQMKERAKKIWTKLKENINVSFPSTINWSTMFRQCLRNSVNSKKTFKAIRFVALQVFSRLHLSFSSATQSEDKATKIVEEFRHCDNADGYLSKRQRLLELYSKLKELEKLFEGHSTSPDWKNFDVSEDED